MLEEIIDSVASISELNLPHYKYIVNVVIGEQRGEGIKIAARCLWDSDSDGHVFDNYITVSNHAKVLMVFTVLSNFRIHFSATLQYLDYMSIRNHHSVMIILMHQNIYLNHSSTK